MDNPKLWYNWHDHSSITASTSARLINVCFSDTTNEAPSLDGRPLQELERLLRATPARFIIQLGRSSSLLNNCPVNELAMLKTLLFWQVAISVASEIEERPSRNCSHDNPSVIANNISRCHYHHVFVPFWFHIDLTNGYTKDSTKYCRIMSKP